MVSESLQRILGCPEALLGTPGRQPLVPGLDHPSYQKCRWQSSTETGGSSRPRGSQVLSMGFVYPHPETMATGRHAPLPQPWHRPAMRPALGSGTARSWVHPPPDTLDNHLVKGQLLFFRTQWEQSSFPALGLRESAGEQRGNAQANSPG